MKINAFAESDRTSSRFGGLIGYWLSEAGTKVASAPKFRQMELSLKKFVVLCYATDELLQDAALLDQTLRQGFSEELALRLDDSIIRGSGAGQPLGILNSGCLVSVARTTPSTIVTADIMSMWGRLLPGSHKNAVWVVNPDSLPTLYQLTVSVGTAGGQTVFIPGGTIQGVPYSTLLGRPLIVSEVGSSLATAGSLILADFTCYGIITKGTKVDTSMHLAYLTDESIYRGVTRIDGQPLLSSSVVPFKGANALSAFVSLAA